MCSHLNLATCWFVVFFSLNYTSLNIVPWSVYGGCCSISQWSRSQQLPLVLHPPYISTVYSSVQHLTPALYSCILLLPSGVWTWHWEWNSCQTPSLHGTCCSRPLLRLRTACGVDRGMTDIMIEDNKQTALGSPRTLVIIIHTMWP